MINSPPTLESCPEPLTARILNEIKESTVLLTTITASGFGWLLGFWNLTLFGVIITCLMPLYILSECDKNEN